MSQDRQADLTADLLRDLAVPERTGEAPAGPAPAPASAPAADGRSRRSATPALSLTLTPLQWSWPVLRRADTGVGVVAGLGPWRVELRV